MDGFIDKFAQRRNAQEIIRANAEAEAQENERLNVLVGDYEKAMQEIRKQNLQNIANADKIRELLEESLKKIKSVQEADAKNEQQHLDELSQSLMHQLMEDLGKVMEEKLNIQKDAIDEMMNSMEEYVHRENVKVYRNVQAVIQEELPKQTVELKNTITEGTAKIRISKALLPVGVLTLIAVLADLALVLMQIFKLI